MPLVKLISGGQSGVDRAALDVAIAAGFPCGGWCPAGRLTEDGVIAPRYPLTELAHGGYRERTIKNVVESDATLIIYFAELHGGTEQTLLYCVRRGKPYKLIDGAEVSSTRAAETTTQFISQHGVSVLNVAGPRSSHAPNAYRYAVETIGRLLHRTSRHDVVSEA